MNEEIKYEKPNVETYTFGAAVSYIQASLTHE